jgi:hypothetical protein
MKVISNHKHLKQKETKKDLAETQREWRQTSKNLAILELENGDPDEISRLYELKKRLWADLNPYNK